ncbi:MAG: redoxin domain-containing protein [Myxococcaceae bacterium]|nr:redoxin domain-containing protein [Myxococcaceae bacterium]
MSAAEGRCRVSCPVRSSAVPLVVGLLLLLSGCAAHQPRISGELKGVGGSRLPHAEVFLSRLDGHFTKPLASTPVSPEGHFSVEVPAPGDYRVWLAAPGYSPQNLLVQVAPEAPSVSFQATLAPYRYHERFEEPSVIGSWNGYAFPLAEPMQPQPDGTWTFEKAVEGESVTYQLLGLAADERSVPGTQAEGYELDRGGDYQCRVRTQEGRVKIVLDPKKLPRQREGASSAAVFAAPHEHLTRINALRAEASELAQKAMGAFMARKGKMPWQADYGELPRKLVGLARDAGQPTLLRQVAALEWLGLPFYKPGQQYPGAEGQALAAELLQLLPPDNPRWVLAPNATPRLAALMAEAEQEPLLRDVAQRNPEPTVRAGANATLLERALKANDAPRVAELREQLQPYAEGNPMVRMMLEMTRTDRKVVKGQPVPSFSAQLLDGQGTVSRESLAGRFYLIDFWAVWCPPCVEELPTLHEAWEKFQGRGGFTLLSVSMDASEEQVRKFREEKWKMPWLNTFSGMEFSAPLPKAFEVNSLPRAVLVDAHGTIIATDAELRGDKLERTLEALLPARTPGQPTPSAGR